MKLAVITPYFPSSAEPWQGRSAYQTLRLIARQADVHVFFPYAAYPALLKPRSRGYQKLDPSYTVPDVDVSYYPYPALPLVSRPLNGWMAARVLLPHVREFAPDLIFSCFLYPDGDAALRIGRTLSVPVVTQSIGSDINRIGDPISAMQTRAVLRNTDFLVTVSDDLCKKAVTMGAHPQKSRAVVNGCDLSVFHPGDRTSARQQLNIPLAAQAIVYIGRMDVKKGLRELVEAAASIHPERPNLHVYLVGAGPDKGIIESAIQGVNASDYIHVMPACQFDEVAVWMTAADLVTLPSYMEGCPNVVLEALACGRPVVATKVGGIPEMVNDECGRLVPPGESAALAGALAAVLGREWDAATIAAHGSRSWNDVAAELLDVFDSLLAKRS
jgi:teichuronic acid biosynthesis glycosyltransferase TuaC